MADGPEAKYADIASGRPSVLDAAIDTCTTTIRHLADAIDLIELATDKPDWDSTEAYRAYNLRAWSARAAAEVSFVRVNRISLATQTAVAAYNAAEADATRIIEWWRQTKRSDLSGDVVSLARAIALGSLKGVASQLSRELAEAIDFVQTDRLTDDQEKWLTNGLTKSMLHDLDSPTDSGPTIPDTFATGDDDGGWTPQGLGFDPDGHPPVLLQGSYSGPASQLSLVDPDTGEQLGHVELGSRPGGTSPDHAGGVTVHDGRVNVMSSDDPPTMYTYSLKEIRDASPGQTVVPLRDPVPIAGGAYSTIDGDTLYVGTFTEKAPGSLKAYAWDAGSKEWVAKPGSYETPPQTQGAAVIDGQMVFSTSWGRGNTSRLQAYRLGDVLAGHGNDADHQLGQVSLPTMSEGAVAIDDTGLITTYESGAKKHSTPSDSAELNDLWGNRSMTITPFSALGMSGGIDVAPVSLERASVDFDASARRLQRAASSVTEVTLPAGCLGSNAQGDAFASMVTDRCDETARWIGEGRISANVTADGLVTSAKSYVAADQAARDVFAAITSWMGGR